MNWENNQFPKIEANYTKSCLEVFYRMVDLKISEISQGITCCGTTVLKFSPSFRNFNKLGPQHERFPKKLQNFQSSHFSNTSGQVMLNLHTILIVSTLYYPIFIWEHGGAGGGIKKLKFIFYCRV